MAVSLPIATALPKTKPFGFNLSSRTLLGLGLGGLTAAYAAFLYYRLRKERQSERRATPAQESFAPESVASAPEEASSHASPSLPEAIPEIASQAWASGGLPTEVLIPGSYSIPDPESPQARKASPHLPQSTGPLGDNNLAMPSMPGSGSKH